jgi:nucleoid DNA-binding protein
MNKTELVEHIAQETGTDKAAAGRALDAALKGISESLAKGDSVALAGFGTFEARSRAARTGRNPQTGESMEIAASTSAGFKPATALKKLLNG